VQAAIKSSSRVEAKVELHWVAQPEGTTPLCFVLKGKKANVVTLYIPFPGA
jgi:hypothetical protein